jgi:hypothetical protein
MATIHRHNNSRGRRRNKHLDKSDENGTEEVELNDAAFGAKDVDLKPLNKDIEPAADEDEDADLIQNAGADRKKTPDRFGKPSPNKVVDQAEKSKSGVLQASPEVRKVVPEGLFDTPQPEGKEWGNKSKGNPGAPTSQPLVGEAAAAADVVWQKVKHYANEAAEILPDKSQFPPLPTLPTATEVRKTAKQAIHAPRETAKSVWSRFLPFLHFIITVVVVVGFAIWTRVPFVRRGGLQLQRLNQRWGVQRKVEWLWRKGWIGGKVRRVMWLDRRFLGGAISRASETVYQMCRDAIKEVSEHNNQPVDRARTERR